MIGLDTNVLVRYLTQDDPVQSPIASRCVESLSVNTPGYICIVTLIEIVWVLKRCYAASIEEIAGVIETIMRTKEIIVENPEIVWKSLRSFRAGGVDFSDCVIMHSCSVAGCQEVVTFDKGAANNCGMRLLEVGRH